MSLHARPLRRQQAAACPRGCFPRSLVPLPACSAKLKLDRLRRRGKAPPKKGAGKRAGKKR